MRSTLLVLTCLFLMSCASVPQSYLDGSHKVLSEQQRDAVECQALASQAAMGSGSWSSQHTVRSVLFEHARDQYLAQCLESRGWVWKRRQ